MKTLGVCPKPPWYFTLLQRWNRLGLRGGVYALRWLQARGALDLCSSFSIGANERMLMPLYFPSLWNAASMEGYERDAVELFSEKVALMREPVILVDCGADIGLFSRHVLMRTSNISTVIAFEPNPVSCEILRKNLENVGAESRVIRAAVSNYTGKGRLESLPERPSYDTHSNYIEADPTGQVQVLTVDDLHLTEPFSLAIKIDVEGGELAVLQGAANSIRRADNVVIQLEAHPGVAKRTSVDPIECLRFIHGLRPCTYHVPEQASVALSLEANFFSQLDDNKIYNVIATSVDRSA